MDVRPTVGGLAAMRRESSPLAFLEAAPALFAGRRAAWFVRGTRLSIIWAGHRFHSIRCSAVRGSKTNTTQGKQNDPTHKSPGIDQTL